MDGFFGRHQSFDSLRVYLVWTKFIRVLVIQIDDGNLGSFQDSNKRDEKQGDCRHHPWGPAKFNAGTGFQIENQPKEQATNANKESK